MKENEIIWGDCVLELKNLKENSVDAIVTDPPYELGFMGKKWDNRGIAYNVNMWKECLRVLKPGGYLLSFGGTRTYHRMACGIEDAGFEIRDCIQWLYGSGFPKSLNIGKQIDKIQGNERELLGIQERYNEPSGIVNVGQGERYKFERKITKGNTEWEGWGTALKPANEPIVVARKPLSEKNVALNVLKWGTGGINIDACRIGTEEELGRDNKTTPFQSGNKWTKNNNVSKGIPTNFNVQGRFPANIILDEEAGKMLDEQSGKTGALAPVKKNQKGFGGVIYNKYKTGGDDGKTFYDKGKLGGASRFFYCAKASKSERNLGCEDLEEKHNDDTRKDKDAIGCNNPNNRSGTPKKNHHPTVKPIKLMEYLIKLVSKEGAVILDPFAGSGTTLLACYKLNRKFIGIEKEWDYIKIAKARLNALMEQRKLK